MLSAISWSALAQGVRTGVNLLTVVLLARLLAPTDFGVLAMVTVFTGFSTVLVDFGLGSALIQDPRPTPERTSAVFWVNALAGLAIAAAVAAAAPLLAEFYDQPRLAPITRVVALTYLLTGVTIVQRSLLLKRLAFKRLALLESAAVVASAAAALALAYLDYGVWALVWQQLTLAAATAALLWSASDWRPTLPVRLRSAAPYLRLGSSLFLNSSSSYLATNLDSLVVGKLFGDFTLGLYDKSYSVVTLPGTNISRVLTKVLLPSLSRIQHDLPRVRVYYTRLLKAVCLATFPLMAIVFAESRRIIDLLLGEQWGDAAWMFRVFSVAGIAYSINLLLGSVVISQDRSDIVYREIYLKRGGTILALLIGVNFGIEGVAYGKTAAMVLSVAVTFYHVRLAIGIGMAEQAAQLAKITLATVLATAFGIYGVRYLGVDRVPLAAVVALILAAYGTCLWVLREEALAHLYAYLRGAVARAR